MHPLYGLYLNLSDKGPGRESVEHGSLFPPRQVHCLRALHTGLSLSGHGNPLLGLVSYKREKIVKEKVVVAMSGGVDSSFTAFLLKEKGYDVIGATMRIWRDDCGEASGSLEGCSGTKNVEDAGRVARQLGIPFHVIDLSADFDREVVRYFCREYARGRTPNPCVHCNEKVKFGAFMARANDLGARYLATGHYARIALQEKGGRYLLKKGKDASKDQSYVLFTLSQAQLGRVLFPLGEYEKKQVRLKAQEIGLPVYNKPESQEICFIQEDSYHPFLKSRLGEAIEPGPIWDGHGNLLGRHKGIAFYTIGQRKGLGLATGKALYVTGIDAARNALIVGEERDVLGDLFIADSVRWIIPPEKDKVVKAEVKIRYNHPGAGAILTPRGNDEWAVKFMRPQKAITPGQAAVFYRGETVLGGGWIREVVRSSGFA